MAVIQYKNFAYIKGPAGQRGVKGDQGPRGLSGDQGPVGLTGRAGAVDYNEVRLLFSVSAPLTYNSSSGLIGFNATGFATETYVNTVVNNLIGNAPVALNTLTELAAALNNDANFSASVITTLAGKLSLAGGTMTGTIVSPSIGNIIPFYFANQASFPTASSAHGAIAHSHSDGKMYYAHGGAWIELANASTIPTDVSDLTDATSLLFSGAYADLTGTPTIPADYVLPVAAASTLGGIKIGSGLSIDGNGVVTATGSSTFSGDYNDLTNKPDLSLKADLSYVEAADDLLSIALDLKANTADLSLVATSGSYTDLTNKPTPAQTDRLVNGTYAVSLSTIGQLNLPSAANTESNNARIQSANSIDILSNLSIWTFGADGKLTAPGNLQVSGGKIILHPYGNAYVESVDYGVNSANSAVNIFGGPYQKIKLRAGFGTQATWTFGTDGYITLANNAQLYDYGNGDGNGYGITDALGSTYIGYDPDDAGGALHMDSYNGKNIRIRTTPVGTSNYKDWLFDSNGVLSIPAGGDIKDSNGNSVLGNGNSFSGSYTDLTNKPTLFSGSYTDLTNKPIIPSDINQLDDVNGLLNSGSGSGASNWGDINFNGGDDFEATGSDSDNYANSEVITDGGDFGVDSNRVAAFVNAGTFVTMDNIKATVTTSGNRGLSMAAVSTSFTCNIGATYALNGGSNGTAAANQTITTTATSSIFTWSFPGEGDISTYIVTDTTNSRCYRITLQIGFGYNNNMISIERLI